MCDGAMAREPGTQRLQGQNPNCGLQQAQAAVVIPSRKPQLASLQASMGMGGTSSMSASTVHVAGHAELKTGQCAAAQ